MQGILPVTTSTSFHSGIVLVAYSPLCKPSHVKESDPKVLVDPVIREMASKHNSTSGQVLLLTHDQCVRGYFMHVATPND